MIKFSEIWKNRSLILEGIKNYIFTNDDIELLAKERLEKCMSCPHVDIVGKKCMMPGTEPCCSLCGCSLELKTRSLSSSCADEKNPKWKAVITEQDEDEYFPE